MTRGEQLMVWLESTAKYIVKKHPVKAADMYRFVMGYSDCNALIDTDYYWELTDKGVIKDYAHDFRILGIPILLTISDINPHIMKKDAEFMYVPEEKNG